MNNLENCSLDYKPTSRNKLLKTKFIYVEVEMNLKFYFV